MPQANDPCTLFWNEGHAAVEAGLVQTHELFTICRPDSRKRNYWDKHLHILRKVIAERRELQQAVRESKVPQPE